jgi:hypothetical protein
MVVDMRVGRISPVKAHRDVANQRKAFAAAAVTNASAELDAVKGVADGGRIRRLKPRTRVTTRGVTALRVRASTRRCARARAA